MSVASFAPPRHALRWLLLLTLLVIGIGYGLREPWPSDEPRFVLVAKQMSESGEWLFPHRGQELYPDKPPVYFWGLALSHAIIGNWRWSFLLPSLLSGLLVIALVFDLGKRLHDERAGWWAAVATLCALQFVYQFKRAQIDPTLIAFTTVSLYAFCRHTLLAPDRRWLLAAGFFAGLGVITKGVGFLPLLLLLPLWLMRRARWRGLAEVQGGAGNGMLLAGAFLLPIVLWLAPLLWFGLRDGNPEHAAYLQNILFKQTAQRYANAFGHFEPPWYFLEIIGMFWLPFSLCFFWLWRDWRDAWRQRDARVWLPLAWGVLVIVFFSLSRGKRDMYILPALPAFALAAGPVLAAWLQRRGAQRVLGAFAFGLGGVLLVAGAAALLHRLPAAAELAADRGLGEEARWLWWMLIGVGSVGVTAALCWRGTRAHWAAGALLLALWSGYGLVAHPVLDGSSSARNVMLQARTLAGEATTLGLVAWEEQNLLQARGAVTEFGFKAPEAQQLQRAHAWLQEAGVAKRIFIGWYAEQPRPEAFACIDLDAGDVQFVGVANRRDWWLLGPQALAACSSGQ